MKICKIISVLILSFIIFVTFTTNTMAKSKKDKSVQNIEIHLKDEMILTGTVTLPKTASIHQKVPVVILLHSLGSNRAVYISMANELKAKNIASLAIDSRGHHNSTTKLSGKKSYWQNYSNKIYEKYPSDILETINFIKEHYSSIDSNRIGIVGADINANAAILAAANPKCKGVKSLVLISPSMVFKGLKSAQALLSFGNHPITIIATQNDVKHHRDATLLAKHVTGKVNFITTQKGGTGDNIIKVNPYLNKNLAEWFSKNL